jgi:2-keto-4-pentenoate hydratase/2-oxohepta-3-ene-1,7-dioic acid hydratase in catechol pathway
VLVAAITLLGCLAPPARGVPPVMDEVPLRPGIAPFDIALTFATVADPSGRSRVVLVTGYDGTDARVIDLPAGEGPAPTDAFEALERLGRERLVAHARAGEARGTIVPMATLAASVPGARHVATGTNFRDHATEVGFAAPFFFPKFGEATPPRSFVEARPGVLLDYEVELCVRFDRPLRSVADFDAAAKGFFLCGDFTDRATLMRLLPDEPAPTGIGFSDAKSGPRFFPTRPFLVIPTDWRAFVDAERIATRVGGERRQDAHGRDMVLDFRALVERALATGAAENWRYRGQPVPLIADGILPAGAALMSGTPAGVVFRPPDTREIACGAIVWVCLGGFLSTGSVREGVIARYTRRLLATDHYLAPGNRVHHASGRLGTIEVEVR